MSRQQNRVRHLKVLLEQRHRLHKRACLACAGGTLYQTHTLAKHHGHGTQLTRIQPQVGIAVQHNRIRSSVSLVPASNTHVVHKQAPHAGCLARENVA